MHPLDTTRRIAAVLRPPRQGGCTRDTPRCDFWNWGADAMRPPCCTQHLVELTRFVHELLTNNGIVHWLDDGALLGAVREQAFVPWDEDVDFGVFEDEAPAILALEPLITASGYRVDTSDPTVIRIYLSAINLVHVDLFRWKEVDGLMRTDFNPDLDWPGVSGHSSFARDYLEELEFVSLYNLTFPAPSPVHKFLADHRYGPDYMVPTRPIISVRLYPDIRPEEMTPEIKDMLAAIADKDRRLAALNTRSRFSGTRLWTRWRRSALPFVPAAPPQSSASGAPTEGGDETVAELRRSLAWLDLAIDEIANPSFATRMRRARRRLVRSAQVARRAVRGGDPEPTTYIDG